MLFVGDDWAEDHHDVEVMDASGRRLARARLPEGMTLIGSIGSDSGKSYKTDVSLAQAARSE